MTAQHTPVPWEQAGNGVIHHWNQNGRGGTLIGEVYGPMGHEDVQANARLIAAAPLMLEALKVAYRYVHKMSGDDGDTLADAIAAATGEDG